MFRAGEVYQVGRAASVQFAVNPIIFRIIRTHDWDTYEGWVWLDGYELNSVGDAVERRSIFVQIAGMRRLSPQPQARNQRQMPPKQRPRDQDPSRS
jgi:hypothetical protein